MAPLTSEVRAMVYLTLLRLGLQSNNGMAWIVTPAQRGLYLAPSLSLSLPLSLSLSLFLSLSLSLYIYTYTEPTSKQPNTWISRKIDTQDTCVYMYTGMNLYIMYVLQV